MAESEPWSPNGRSRDPFLAKCPTNVESNTATTEDNESLDTNFNGNMIGLCIAITIYYSGCHIGGKKYYSLLKFSHNQSYHYPVSSFPPH